MLSRSRNSNVGWKAAIALLPLWLLAGCASSGGGSPAANSSVWESYDFRHPVPYNSPVPVSRATTYDQYMMDNDAYYVQPKNWQPKNWGDCQPGDPGCE